MKQIIPLNQSPHIRGRVFQTDKGYFKIGERTMQWGSWYTHIQTPPVWVPPCWGWQVINTKTGKVLCSDNGRLQFEQVVEDCNAVVELARLSIFWSFAKGKLK